MAKAQGTCVYIYIELDAHIIDELKLYVVAVVTATSSLRLCRHRRLPDNHLPDRMCTCVPPPGLTANHHLCSSGRVGRDCWSDQGLLLSSFAMYRFESEARTVWVLLGTESFSSRA